MGIRQGDLLGGVLFVLTHFKALHSIVNHFPSCLFPSIIDNIHIIGPLSIVSSAYKHFHIELCAICIAWSLSNLPLDFNTPSQFTTPFEGIKILGVLLSIITFTSSFIKETLQKDARHVDLFPKMGDVQVAFGILTCCFVQCLLYFLQCTPPFSTFIKFVFFILPSIKCLDAFCVQDFFIAQKDL
jgi:hypothetical protein